MPGDQQNAPSGWRKKSNFEIENDKKCKAFSRRIIYGDPNNQEKADKIQHGDVVKRSVKQFITEHKLQWFKRIGVPYLEAFNTTGSIFYLLNIIASGYPDVYQEVMKNYLTFGAPLVGTVSATGPVIGQGDYSLAGVPTAYVKAVNKTIMMTASNSQISFDGVSDIIRQVKKLSADAPVDIGDVAAWSIILINFFIALFRGIQAYHIENANSSPVIVPSSLFKMEGSESLLSSSSSQSSRIFQPSRLSKAREFIDAVACSGLLTRACTFTEVLGVTNLFIGELEAIFFPKLGFEGPIIRYSAAATLGAIASIISGGSVKEKRSTAVKIADTIWDATRSAGLAMMIGRRLADPNERDNYSWAVISEQIAFWFVILSCYIFFLQLGRHWATNQMIDRALEFDDEENDYAPIDEETSSCSILCCCCPSIDPVEEVTEPLLTAFSHLNLQQSRSHTPPSSLSRDPSQEQEANEGNDSLTMIIEDDDAHATHLASTKQPVKKRLSGSF